MRARYSTSIVDKATISCFLEFQVTQPPPILVVYPEINFPSSRPAKSASMYIWRSRPFGFCLNIFPTFLVALRYQNTCFIAVKCISMWFVINWLRCCAMSAILGHVPNAVVTNHSWSETGIGSEFRLEQSSQVSEEGNRIELGFNLCVMPLQHYEGYVLQFQEDCWRPKLVRGQTEVRLNSERSLSVE